VAMLFCQLAQAKNLREICGGLACCMGKLRNLGMKNAPNKSTLSYAELREKSRQIVKLIIKANSTKEKLPRVLSDFGAFFRKN